MTFLDSTITGNSSSFHCGPDTNTKILKVQKQKNNNKKLNHKKQSNFFPLLVNVA